MNQRLQSQDTGVDATSFDHLVELAAKVMQCAEAFIVFEVPTHETKARVAGVVEGSSLVRFARTCDEVTVISDVQADPEFAIDPMLAGDRAIGYFACSPLLRESGERIGTLCVADTRARPRLRSNEVDAMDALASAIVFDIELEYSRHELHLQELELQRMTEVQALKDEFVATVSHELRTPLTSIAASLALLEDDIVGEISDDAREIIGVASSNSTRLIALVDDLLDLEWRSSFVDDRAFSSAPIADLVSQAVAAVEGKAQMHGISLVYDDHLTSDTTLNCDSDRIVQLMVNLLDNAVKFSELGSEVVLRAQLEDPEHVSISVVDSGRGIAEEYFPRLFDAFWQADSSASRTVGGSGLGLAICRRIIEQHRGRVEVVSELGVGSTFRVVLPLDARGVQDASVSDS